MGGDAPAWATPRRGPIPRSVARIKENSPFRAWHVPMLSHPSRPHTRPCKVPLLSLDKAGLSSGIAGANVLHASSARGASQVEQKLFSRMAAAFSDGQMGMPPHMLETPQRWETFDRAQRCALVPPPHIKPEPLAQILASAPGSVRASWAAGSQTERERHKRLTDPALCPLSETASSGTSRTQRLSNSAIHLARLSRPSARHISICRSLSPRKSNAKEEASRIDDESADVLLEQRRIQLPGATTTTVAPKQRIVDDGEPPFLWPDNLWSTPHTLPWQKNGGKPKLPPKSGDKADFRFKFFWDKLSEDETYLQDLTFNDAYRGQVKARNLNEKELATAKMKAAQISYMWMRRQIKEEEHTAAQGKDDRKREFKEKREEEERVLMEECHVEREAQRREQLYRLTDLVFNALCHDPETGLPIDPRVIFRRLDTDGGGTVDVDEFRNGLLVCGCSLTDDELQLVWEEIDGADGDSDGQVCV